MRVRFQNAGGMLDDVPIGSPVIEVVLRLDPDAGSGPRLVDIQKKYVALIDTGANLNCIDPRVLSEQNLSLVGKSHVHSATSSIDSTYHLGHLFRPEEGIQFETDFVVTPLRANGRHFDVVIGRLLLRRARLVMDYLRNDFRLEFK